MLFVHSKSQGRPGRVGRSSDVGRFWDSPIQKVYRSSDGNYSTAIDLYQKGMGTSKLNREVAGMHFLRRKHCGHPTEVDSHGFACCPICGLAFNDGVSGEDRADVEIMAVGYTPLQEQAPPPGRYRKPKRAAR